MYLLPFDSTMFVTRIAQSYSLTSFQTLLLNMFAHIGLEIFIARTMKTTYRDIVGLAVGMLGLGYLAALCCVV